MPLSLEFNAAAGLPVELTGLTPDWTRSRTADDIARLAVPCGKQRVPLAELFQISGDPADGRIELSGDLTGVQRIGAGMAAGEIRVEGSVGSHAGADMRGGRLEIRGSAGDWLGAEMRGGQIHVHGSAVHHAAAAYPGSPRGMTGGELFIDGDAGDDLGRAMRRGLVALGGSAGDDLGARMLAGTILVLGACGRRVGADLRRGTLALLGPPPELLPTYAPGGRFRPQFMQLLLTHLRRAGFAVPQTLFAAEYTTHHGDMLALGRGEILLRI